MPKEWDKVAHIAPAPDGFVAVSDAVRLMTREEFDALKAIVLPLLRAKGDPAPRILQPGRGDRASWFRNVRELLARTPGGTLVRGYKLFVFRLDPHVFRSIAWKAQFHVVVARAGESGKLLYECANKGHPGNEEELPFVFVPSSRAHSELTDEQLLSGDWHLGSVVGGDAFFEMRFVAHEKLQGRAQSVVDSNPDALKAKPRQYTEAQNERADEAGHDIDKRMARIKGHERSVIHLRY